MPATALDIALLSAGVAYFAFVVMRQRKRRHPYPPTPKGIPILGNALQIPVHESWLAFRKMSEDLQSDIVHLNAAGQSIIVLNNVRDAKELLVKRSKIYSSRPQALMCNELMGWGWMISGRAYDAEWRVRRRLFQRHFQPSDVALVQTRTQEHVDKLLSELLESPANFKEHIRHLVGGLAYSLAYGIQIAPTNDPHLKLAEEALEPAAKAIVPGAYLVDVLPFLKYVPEWFPGAGFKRDARVWKVMMERYRSGPYDLAERAFENQTARTCLVSMALESTPEDQRESQKDVIKDAAGMFFTAGFDTTRSALTYFVLAMITFPEVQAKAQRELDAVVGSDRLPDFSDRERLPYISAILEEVLRWWPAAGLAVPHLSTEDDIYQGYFIPKESVVIANVWGMLHNEEEYPESHLFRPERYLDESGAPSNAVMLPSEVAFGFGRRICPGLHIGQEMLWLTVASVLATFNFSKAKDAQGREIEPEISCEPGLVAFPKPFDCTIIPRSRSATNLVKQI